MARQWFAGSGEQLEQLLDVLAEAVTVTAADGQLVFANAAALERMGMSRGEAIGSTPGEVLARFEITDEHGRQFDPETFPGRRLLRGEEPTPSLLRLVEHGTGRILWTMVKATAFEDDQGRQLAVNVLEDVTETKEQEMRERFLAAASEVFASSLDYEQTLQQVARLAVPHLADWCSVDMLVNREIRQVAVAHADPEKLTFALEVRRRYPPQIDDPSGLGAVLRTGEPALYPTISEEMLIANALDEEHVRLLREVHMRSAMVVPMLSREQAIIGAITFVAAETAGRYDEDDRGFLEDFARRAASAVENARLYRERSETAAVLQRSLIPAALPEVAGWRAATRYRPAAPGADVGGDFFDLFLTDGGFTVLIGDVTGKGPAAAAITALTRYSARTAATLGLEPAAILGLLNRLLLEQPELSPVTAIVAQLVQQTDRATLTLACAGHPLPVRVRAGEPPVELGSSGIVLGFDSAASWQHQLLDIEADDTLLFYTDGLTDAIGAEDRFGEGRLYSLLARSTGDPDELLKAVERAVEGFRVGEAADDIAMLAVKRLATAAAVAAPAASLISE